MNRVLRNFRDQTARSLVATLVCVGLAPMVAAQGGGPCQPEWVPTFGQAPTANGILQTWAQFDDGSGLSLFAGGQFTELGGVAAKSVGRWDGERWHAVGEGVTGGPLPSVWALCAFDDGSGPALFAGGRFQLADGQPAANLAKWDGSTWSPVGGGAVGEVYALAVHDDGSGPKLYAGGSFASVGSVSGGFLARWDGVTWESVGQGFNDTVFALSVFDEGNGPALFAGGHFTASGATPLSRVARWDGNTWSALGAGVDGPSAKPSVRVFEVFDDGSGPALYAGGEFLQAGGGVASAVARWDGVQWSPLGAGVNNVVFSLEGHLEGGVPTLFVGGWFGQAGGAPASRVARWSQGTWSPVSTGLAFGFSLLPGGAVYGMSSFDSGNGPELYVGGEFDAVGGALAKRAARWNGTAWRSLGSGLTGAVHALAVYDFGAGPEIVAGGSVKTGGGFGDLRGVARWNGSAWFPVGAGFDLGSVYALLVRENGDLIAAGDFLQSGLLATRSIARWEGGQWLPLGGGFPVYADVVYALAEFDDGSGRALYAGGQFGLPNNGVARWQNGQWSPVGAGLVGSVRALAVHDDGSGPALFAGGSFFLGGGQIGFARVAKWDGVQWDTSIGQGIAPSAVFALVSHTDATGPGLYAGGLFATTDTGPASGVARWNGSQWFGLGAGVDPNVRSLTSYDDGFGRKLYAGGVFTTAGGAPANYVASWDGANWAPLGEGTSLYTSSFVAYEQGGERALIVGHTGGPNSAGDSQVGYWRTCAPAAPAAALAGCADANPATLVQNGGSLKLGNTLGLRFEGAANTSGPVLLYVGTNGADAQGCGLLVPGLGEFLIQLTSPWTLAAQQPHIAGAAQFTLPVPQLPSLLGQSFAFQGAHVAVDQFGFPIELSNGLLATLQ